MSSTKRKTPARRKTTPAPSPLSVSVTSAEPSAAQTAEPIPAPTLVEAAPPPPAAEPVAASAPPALLPRLAPARRFMSHEERHRMIAKTAYGFAEKAGFRNNPVEDWLMAEREVEATLRRLAS